MNAGKILIGVFAGLTAGAALGILFAQDKGSNTRKKMSGSGEDFMEEMKEKFYDFLETSKGKWNRAKLEAQDMMEKGMAKEQDIMKEVKNVEG